MTGTRDPEFFASLYESVYRDLYKYAYYVLGNVEDAEDAVSAAVLDGYASFGKLREIDSFKSWMFAILSAKCKRKLKTYVNKTLELPETLEAQSLDTDSNMDVRNAFQTLSPKERQIVGMSVIAGYSSREVGKILGMNDNTVRSIQKRALDKMRQRLV